MPYIGNITQDFNVSNAMLDTDSVTSIKIVDGTIEGADIAANLDLSDTQKIRFGAGNDLQIYHNGSHSYIDDAGTGNLYIRSSQLVLQNAAGDEDLAILSSNGAVKLYFDDSKKFETTSEGVLVTNLHLGDLGFIELGASDDFRIYHDGTDSYLYNLTGEFKNRAATWKVVNQANNESMIVATENGAAELYYDNSKKLETTSSGIDLPDQLQVDGTVFATGGLKINSDSNKLRLGASDDLQIFHNGTDSRIVNTTGDLSVRGGVIKLSSTTGEEYIRCTANSSVDLFHDNVVKLTTNSDGYRSNDNVKAQFGVGSDLQIYHDGTHSYIDNSTGVLFIRNTTATKAIYSRSDELLLQSYTGNENYIVSTLNGAVDLYYDNSKKLETTSTGSQTTGMHLIKGNSDIDNQFNPLLFLQDSTNTNIKAVFLLEDDYTTGRAALAINVGESGVTNDRDLMLQKAGGRVGIRCTPTENFEVSGTSKFNGAIKLGDGNALKLGAGEDLQISHVGGGISKIDFSATAHNFKIQGPGGSNFVGLEPRSGYNSIKAIANAAAELYYDNSKKFETTSSGADVTGRLTTDGVFIGDGGNNDVSLSIGSNNDLRLYHEGNHSYIIDRGTGELRIGSDSGIRLTKHDSETVAFFDPDGQVELYYDNSKKFETTSTGITVSGTEHKFTSGTNGDCKLIIEADTDNNNEDDNPLLIFRQDGELDLSVIGTGLTGTSSDNHLTLANSAANGGISFRTGTANGYTNAIERMRVLAQGGLTFNGDTSNNNALSDYEQGTWTATAEFSTGGFKSCANNVCRYVKVGTLVHVSGRFSLNNHTGASSGELRIEGLPFSKGNPSGDGNSAGIQVYVEGAATNITSDICGLVLDNTTQFLIRQSGLTGSGNDMAGKTDSGTTLLIGGTYTTFG